MIEGEPHRGARLAAFAFGGLLLGALIGGAVVLTRDDGAEAPTVVDPNAPVAGVVGTAVPTEDLVLADRLASTVARHQQEIVIVDGFGTTDAVDPAAPGADPHLRLWSTTTDESGTATPTDFPTTGALAFVETWWWDGEWGIVGTRCPEPWQGDIDETPEPPCGSAFVDVLAFDPETSTLRTVLSGLEAPSGPHQADTLRPLALNQDEVLLSWGSHGNAMTLTPDGTTTPVDPLPAQVGSMVMPAGETYVALSYTGDRDEAENRPVDEYFSVRRLRDGAWETEELPTAPVEVTFVGNSSSRSEAFEGSLRAPTIVVNGSHSDPQDNTPVAVALRLDPRGDLAWEELPLDQVVGEAGYVQLDVVDDRIVASTDTAGTFVYDVPNWHSIAEGIGNRAVFLNDYTTTLRLEPVGGMSNAVEVIIA